MNTDKAFELIDAFGKKCRWQSRSLANGKNYRINSKTTISAYSSNTDKPGAIEIAFETANISSIAGRQPSEAARLVSKLQNEVAAFASSKTSYKLPRISVQSFGQLITILEELGKFLGVASSSPLPEDQGSQRGDNFNVEPDKRMLTEILSRRGQTEFRAKLLDAYNGRCAVTGCNAAAALEAAHIVPHSEHQSYETSHGVLLRADIHTLFDLYLLSVDPSTGGIVLAPELKEAYAELDGKKVALPSGADAMPDPQFLMTHFQRWVRRNAS